jgi:hypothetical protein
MAKIEDKIEDWRFIAGYDGHDQWVRISPNGKILLIGEAKYFKGGVERTVRIEKIGE